jgi:hypothetical protein
MVALNFSKQLVIIIIINFNVISNFLLSAVANCRTTEFITDKNSGGSHWHGTPRLKVYKFIPLKLGLIR